MLLFCCHNVAIMLPECSNILVGLDFHPVLLKINNFDTLYIMFRVTKLCSGLDTSDIPSPFCGQHVATTETMLVDDINSTVHIKTLLGDIFLYILAFKNANM